MLAFEVRVLARFGRLASYLPFLGRRGSLPAEISWEAYLPRLSEPEYECLVAGRVAECFSIRCVKELIS